MASWLQSRWLACWLIGYVALVVAIVGGMIRGRHKVLAEFSTPASLADWETWREDVKRLQANPGPVVRRVPKSVEPPVLVLMRDYFLISLVGATMFTSMLYWVVAWLALGSLRGTKPEFEHHSDR